MLQTVYDTFFSLSVKLETMIKIQEATDEFTIRIYTSTSGALLAFIVSCTLLINVSIKYKTIRQMHKSGSSSPSNKQVSKVPYILVLIYLSLIAIASASYAFIRTNAFTRIKDNQFTKFQCAAGYSLSYLLWHCSVGLFYAIFIWRIQITLKDSNTIYHTYIFNIMYILIIIITLLWWAIEIWWIIGSTWIINSHHGVSLCFTDPFDQTLIKWYDSLALVTVIYHFVMSSILLIIFVKGLWRINRLFIDIYVKKFSKTTDDDGSHKVSIGRVLDQSQETKESAQNAKHILKLYDLIKKQTIFKKNPYFFLFGLGIMMV